MSNCPVCETPNPPNAAECGTCGKVFFKAAVPDAPAAALLELDTGRVDARALAVPLDVTPDLDLGRSAPVSVPVDVTPDIDLGRSAPVANVVADVTPDMEQTAVAQKEWTPLSDGPVLCRACGTPQTDLTSILCGNCGRRLPVVAAMTGVIIDATPVGGGAAPEKVKCFACGARVYPAELCSDCGMPMRPAEAS